MCFLFFFSFLYLVHVVQPYSHYHLCTGIPPHWAFFPFLTGLAAHHSAVCVIQPPPPPSPPVNDLIPLLTSPLNSIHSCLAGCWSGPAASVAWFRVRPITFPSLCACLCLWRSHVEPYFARPSQQNNNEAKRLHSLKRVFRLMALSIRPKSLSNTSCCLFFSHLNTFFRTNCISIAMSASSNGFEMSVFSLQRPPLSLCSDTLREIFYTQWHLCSLRSSSLSEIISSMFSR